MNERRKNAYRFYRPQYENLNTRMIKKQQFIQKK